LKTDELIESLVHELRPAGAGPQAWLALGAAAGGAVAIACVLTLLGPRQDLADAAGGLVFWTKAGYTILLGAAGYWLSERLARPATSPRGGVLLASAVFTAMLCLAVVQLAGAPPDMRMHLWLGHSWTFCSRAVLLLSLPVLAVTLAVLRRQAPTRPMWAGAAAGLFSGGVGATVYGLSCPESAAPFLVTWYTLGVLGSVVLGALAGRFVLRW
jgi:hypothetical protein